MRLTLRSKNDILAVNEELLNILPQLEKTPFVCEIKPYKPQRSLDANARFHVLVNKMAKILNISETECKRNLNLEYGFILKDENDMPVGFKLPRTVDVNKVYPYAKFIKEVKEEKAIFNCYLLYKRTSELDTQEMHKLLEATMQEAKELGINVKSPQEMAEEASLKNGL